MMIDHANRLLQSRFSLDGNVLCIGGIPVTEIAKQYGTPIFVYDQSIIEANIARLRDVYSDRFDLHYSIKANPNAAILKCFLDHGCGLEIASGGELHQALHAGCSPKRLIFAGPGKTIQELKAAVQAGVGELHLESIDEAVSLDAIASSVGKKIDVSLRINPVDGGGGAMRMGGQSSPFGIDEECLDEVVERVLSLQNLHLEGLHLFMGTQILSADVLLDQYQRGLQIARRMAEKINRPLGSIDFGGGLGIATFSKEAPLDLDHLARGMTDLIANIDADPLLSTAKLIIEPGRFLVGEAGVYLSSVTRMKQSRGKTYAVIDGGMHHHLAASGNLGQTIKRNYPSVVANRVGCQAVQTTEVVGPLCTPLDTLARKAELPAMQQGDLFAVFQSGAYARTSSPHGFLSHDSPAEVLVHRGESRLIRRRGAAADFLRDQAPASAEETV
ncbi:diaminopimelate decarboxylase [Aporhodopirellula aestuarii]|uniref:Diaminopimelate decarboxylase n=1 Tax=Aporhodopirellula aestuarii TaxID=2950107 RepID=A0ABT0UDK6_9BACT|nr:diaminopimelate decarboxylase [Aporhodopirellula aestuarii]MCM2375133.1 diaminopimelate decarboxylase [Aporhodopirellula aestuarii]